MRRLAARKVEITDVSALFNSGCFLQGKSGPIYKRKLADPMGCATRLMKSWILSHAIYVNHEIAWAVLTPFSRWFLPLFLSIVSSWKPMRSQWKLLLSEKERARFHEDNYTKTACAIS